MNDRQAQLLTAIIEEFIRSAEPVGSKNILASGTFDVCGATIRNEMRLLSDEGYIVQPHTSAGRVPTTKGYRLYVEKGLKPTASERAVRQKFDSLKMQYLKRKDQERVYDAVALLAHMTPNVAFASVPHKKQVYFLGFHNLFRQPEFLSNPMLATGVAEVLEEHFAEVLGELTVDSEVRYYIGEEHVLPQVQSCSILVTEYALRGEKGAIGILGPMRMDYAFNTSALDMGAGLLRSE
jgi:transcriptional regulator of heat shock response